MGEILVSLILILAAAGCVVVGIAAASVLRISERNCIVMKGLSNLRETQRWIKC